MLLSKSCIYGIRAAIYLAIQEDRHFVPIKEIADKLDISFHFLTKVLQILTQAGLIKSEKGPKGGVALLKPSKKISIYDVIYALDGAAVLHNCALGFPGCSDENPCSLHKIWKVTKTELRTDLQTANLRLMAKDIVSGSIRLFDIE